jgi:adenylosuccinate synthase
MRLISYSQKLAIGGGEMDRAVIIADIGYGDTGKGTITDFLSRQSDKVLIVRYNGGPQAAHNVVTPECKHTFSQFGSGTLVPGVRTHLSHHVMVNPINLFNENNGLEKIGVNDALSRLTVDERAIVITPFHKAANRIREMVRGAKRHGSCGEGVSEAVSDSLVGNCLRVSDLYQARRLRERLYWMMHKKCEELKDLFSLLPDTEEAEYEMAVLNDENIVELIIPYYANFINRVRIVGEGYLRGALNESSLAIFEGAQGVLLDVDIGFFPHVTRSDITPALAFDLLGEEFSNRAIVLGTTRIYATRHGHGPFVSESPNIKIQPAENNEENEWQGPFRIGYLDTVAARYAIQNMGKLDYLAVTCVDRLCDIADPISICDAYQYRGGNDGLSQYFDMAGDKIIGLKKQPSFTEQQGLTNRLYECNMQLTPVRDILVEMENRLGKQIAIVSSGMMAQHKDMIVPILG